MYTVLSPFRRWLTKHRSWIPSSIVRANKPTMRSWQSPVLHWTFDFNRTVHRVGLVVSDRARWGNFGIWSGTKHWKGRKGNVGKLCHHLCWRCLLFNFPLTKKMNVWMSAQACVCVCVCVGWKNQVSLWLKGRKMLVTGWSLLRGSQGVQTKSKKAFQTDRTFKTCPPNFSFESAQATFNVHSQRQSTHL